MKFYVYQHLKADTKEPFYIGKGKNNRAYTQRLNNKHWTSIVNKHGLEVEILAYFKEETDAFEFEIKKIAECRSLGYNLANKTDGGEGSAGYTITVDQKRKISESLKGRNTWSKGRKLTEEHIKNRTASQKGLKKGPRSDKHRKNLSNSLKGKPSNKKGRSYEEIYGIEKAIILKQNKSKYNKENGIAPKVNTKGKTYEEIHGVEKAKELKLIRSNSMKEINEQRKQLQVFRNK